MIDVTAFRNAYKALNRDQKKAVDSIEGPVMVIAGPGTGKTQILTLRIVHILEKTDVMPENILALTFTDAGARAMRERLRSYIGAPAYRVNIFTFHGFAERLIKEYPESYEKVIGGRAATDIEKIEMVETILEDRVVQMLRPIGNPAFYVPHILHMMSTMKREYITHDRLAEIIARQEEELQNTEQYHEKGAHKGKVRGDYQKLEKAIAKNKELLYVYRRYDEVCRQDRLYDYDDMILETISALEKSEDMLRDLQETYQYILADEHQDVNRSQNKILALLASYHDNPNLFVVGDEKQAIFRFQGASLENFLYFEDAFPGTVTIPLTKNYRSGQTILDASHSLIAVPDGPAVELRVPLVAEAVEKSSVEVRSFSHQSVEDEIMTSQIQHLIEQGAVHNEIAVIVRTNKEVELYATLLRKKGVEVVASADGDILEHPITHVIRKLIDAVVVPENESTLFEVLHGAYWGIETDDFVRIQRKRNFEYTLEHIISNEKILKEIGVSDVAPFKNVVRVLREARALETKESPQRVLEFLLRESGFLDNVLAHDPLESGRVVRRLYDEIEEMVKCGGAMTLRDISRALTTRVAYGLPLTAPYLSFNTNAVAVMTAHKSKGLEFQHVFVPHLTDHGWGGRKRSEYFRIPLIEHVDESVFDAVDDERRLLYVAMTRAKEHLYLSSSTTDTDGREFVPSRLLEDVDDTFLTQIDTVADEKDFDPMAVIKQSVPLRNIDADLCKSLLLTRGLSVTALNNYLRSPWDYLYRNVLRIPEIPALPMLFGTAMHGTLEVVAKQKGKVRASELSHVLKSELAKLPITKEEYVTLHEKGLSALTVYLETVQGAFGGETTQEFACNVTLETEDAELPQIPLKGVIDRLDFDTKGNLVRFVDYKTGAPKTRNVIEGNTKTSHGDYKRQLVFYALLLSLYDDERYQCREGVLSFVEPDKKGTIHEETYHITDVEIEELTGEIIRVGKEIVSGSFLSEPCDENQSSYCRFVRELLGNET